MMGMEMMMQAAIKSLGLNPEEIRKQVGDIGKVIVAFKEQMDRVEENQRAIMQHLGIPLDVEILAPKKED